MWRTALHRHFKDGEETSNGYGEDLLSFLKSLREYEELIWENPAYQSQTDLVDLAARRVGLKLPLIEEIHEKE
jgi:hypothetical protein